MLAGSGARAQADSASSGKQYSKQLHMKGVIYIIYREYLQVRKKHHFTENKKAHRGFGPPEMTLACVRSSLALGQQGDNGRAYVLGGGGKEHWDLQRKRGAGRMGLRAKVGTQEARSERPKLDMWHC